MFDYSAAEKNYYICFSFRVLLVLWALLDQLGHHQLYVLLYLTLTFHYYTYCVLKCTLNV